MSVLTLIRWGWMGGFFLPVLVCAQTLLPPSAAFRPTTRVLDAQTIEVRFEIARGYSLYRDKFHFRATPAQARLGEVHRPEGIKKSDETFGEVEVYYDEVTFRLPVLRGDEAGALSLVLTVASQGCADLGVCYPPQQQTFALTLPAMAGDGRALSNASNDESGRIVNLLRQASLGGVVLSFLGFGLLLSLTPCIFPMLPILSGIIVGADRNAPPVSHARGFVLSLAYVLGMAVTYALAGIFAGFSGTLISSSLQHPLVLAGFALLFVLLALAMFGFYELQLPTALQSRISEKAAHLQGGALSGVALMGALSALMVGPCVAAPLAGALLYISQTGNAMVGGFALFCLALGMGIPLLVVGASAGSLLPRSGPWMTSVKKGFGFILLATAVWIVAPLVPNAVSMAAWAILLVIAAVQLRALDRLPPQAGGVQRFWKGIGVVLLLAGTVLLVGAFSGATNPLQPLSALRTGETATSSPPLPLERIESLEQLTHRLQTSTRPTLLDFYADWCAPCRAMERETLTDPRVRQRLSDWQLLKVDLTRLSDARRELLAHFRLFGPPGYVFFDRAGQEISGIRVVGFQNADEFLATLDALERRIDAPK